MLNDGVNCTQTALRGTIDNRIELNYFKCEIIHKTKYLSVPFKEFGTAIGITLSFIIILHFNILLLKKVIC